MTHKALFFTLFLLILILMPIGYFFLQKEQKTEVIKIAPIEIETTAVATLTTQSPKNQPTSNDEIFSQFETAVQQSKQAASNDEIAHNVLNALEKSVNKPLETSSSETSIEDKNTTKSSKVHTVQAKPILKEKTLPKKEEVIQIAKPTKPIKEKESTQTIVETQTQTPKIATTSPKKVKHTTAEHSNDINHTNTLVEPIPQKKPEIILVSKESHATITNVNTLIENTHPQEELQIYNGSKAYVLDESAQTEEILITQEEFENLPWSKTYGVIEESESFELEEE